MTVLGLEAGTAGSGELSDASFALPGAGRLANDAAGSGRVATTAPWSADATGCTPPRAGRVSPPTSGARAVPAWPPPRTSNTTTTISNIAMVPPNAMMAWTAGVIFDELGTT